MQKNNRSENQANTEVQALREQVNALMAQNKDLKKQVAALMAQNKALTERADFSRQNISRQEMALIEKINNTKDSELNSLYTWSPPNNEFKVTFSMGARSKNYTIMMNPEEVKATLLMEACSMGSSVAIDLLRQRGVDPNVADDHGNTPLMWAVRYNKPTAISALGNFENLDVNQCKKVTQLYIWQQRMGLKIQSGFFLDLKILM